MADALSVSAPTIRPLYGHGRAASPAEIARTAQEFEAVFLTQTISQMFETVEIGSMGGGHAEDQWRSVLAGAMADEIAGTGRTGISESIADTLRERILRERASAR